MQALSRYARSRPGRQIPASAPSLRYMTASSRDSHVLPPRPNSDVSRPVLQAKRTIASSLLFSTSPSHPLAYDRDERDESDNLYESLVHCDERWGFVVYRTTYLDDEQWERAKQIIIEKGSRYLPTPDMLNYMDWVFVDDKATLDGASRLSLRRRFHSWAATTAREKGVTLASCLYYQNSRYFYFMEIDEPSLQSIAGEGATPDSAHFNLIDSRWEAGMVEYDSEEERLADLEYEAETEPIDGCREEYVGWTKVRLDSLSVEFQILVDGFLDGDMYFKYYQRPPALGRRW